MPRSEFDGYIRRHEVDSFAHAPMRDKLRTELIGEGDALSDRLTDLERWQQRVIGALGLLALVLTGGGVTVVIELARR